MSTTPVTTPVSRDELDVVQIHLIKTLVDQLAALDLAPLHLYVDALHVGDTRPNVRLHLRYRTDFERYVEANGWGRGVRERVGASRDGSRAWYVEADTEEMRLLVECVSFAHHDDFTPRTEATS